MKIKIIGMYLCAMLGIVACNNSGSSAPGGPIFAYIGDSSNNVWMCKTTATGSFGTCNALVNTTAPGFNQSHGVQFNTFGGQTYAYVIDVSSNIWQCPVNSAGVFGSGCNALTNGNGTTSAFNTTIDLTFATFNGQLYAYVSDASHTLWQCPIDATDGTFTSCNPLTNSTTPFINTRTVAFGTFNGTTYGYISDTSHNIWQCPMNATGGFSGGCTAIPGFLNTRAAIFASFGGTKYLYVSNFNDVLYQCPLNANGGIASASSCTALTTSNPAFFQTRYVTFANFGGTSYAYVGDQEAYALQCPINPNNGQFSSNCISLVNSTPPGFIDAITTTFYQF